MLVGDQATAEDVVQEAFLGLYRAWDRVRDPDAVLGYLRTAVVNGARSVHRSRGRARLLRVPLDPPVWSAEAAAMDGEDRRALLAAIATAAAPGRPPAGTPAGATPDNIQLSTWEWEGGQGGARSQQAATSAAI